MWVGNKWEAFHAGWVNILFSPCQRMGVTGGILIWQFQISSSAGKESACNAGDPVSIPGSGRSPGEELGYPLQYSWAFLVAQMVKNLPAMRETWDLDSTLGLGRSPGGGHGNPLQYSCLKNPHGQRSLAGYKPWGHKESDMTERLRTAQHTLSIQLIIDILTFNVYPFLSSFSKVKAFHSCYKCTSNLHILNLPGCLVIKCLALYFHREDIPAGQEALVLTGGVRMQKGQGQRRISSFFKCCKTKTHH